MWSCVSVSGAILDSWMERLIRCHNFDGPRVCHLFDARVLNAKADSNMHRRYCCDRTRHEKRNNVFCMLFDFV